MITNEQLDKLKEFAQKATPGPWIRNGFNVIDKRYLLLVADTYVKASGGMQGEANAAYIAAASPDVVLALIGENERLKEEMKGKIDLVAASSNYELFASAHARAERLEKEADWLAGRLHSFCAGFQSCIECPLPSCRTQNPDWREWARKAVLNEDRIEDEEKGDSYPSEHNSELTCIQCKSAKALPGKRKCAACLQKNRNVCADIRRRYREKGICVQCGRSPAMEGRSRCADCIGKMRLYNRKRYRQCKENGICIHCGVRLGENETVYCSECSKKNREQSRDARHRLYARHKQLGICTRCHKNPAATGKTKCAECLLKMREAAARRYERLCSGG